ncbi:MAG: hypothetical protein JWM84_281 [Nocardioides sp.]|nr:hypothetical protein [Nocardioides sp.]
MFTNWLGQHTLRRSGLLLPLGIDPNRGGLCVVDTDVAPLGAYHPEDPDPGTLTEYAAKVRRYAEQLPQHAVRLREAADQYDDMAADGWELTRFDEERHWGSGE